MPRFYLFLSLAFSSSAAFGQGPQVAPLTPVQPKMQLPKADSIVVTIAPYRQIRLYCGGGRLIRNEEVEPKYWLLQPLLTAIPGIQVTPHSGAPGDWAAVRIRGGSTLAGTDQPLYVVYGVPALNNDFVPVAAPGSGSRIGQGQVPQLAGPNPLLFLPVEDIEQITVLTGALGTARYGAQGSNGVLLITTKRGGMAGQKKPLRVRYAGLGGVQQVRQRYELLDARQYAELANEAWTNAPTHYQPKPYSPAALAALGPGTDWQAEIMRDAFVQSHHLALDGSSARTRYLLSTDFLDQAGVVRGSGLRRYQLRLNLDHRASDKLRLHLSARPAGRPHRARSQPRRQLLPVRRVLPIPPARHLFQPPGRGPRCRQRKPGPPSARHGRGRVPAAPQPAAGPHAEPGAKRHRRPQPRADLRQRPHGPARPAHPGHRHHPRGRNRSRAALGVRTHAGHRPHAAPQRPAGHPAFPPQPGGHSVWRQRPQQLLLPGAEVCRGALLRLRAGRLQLPGAVRSSGVAASRPLRPGRGAAKRRRGGHFLAARRRAALACAQGSLFPQQPGAEYRYVLGRGWAGRR